MSSNVPLRPERTTIAGSLEIPRMLNGLWQLAGGHDQHVDIARASDAMDALIDMGLDCFDVADHYGDAELVVGHHNAHSGKGLAAFTKWCPVENGTKTFENAEAAVDLALQRMGQKQISLLQYHIWDYTDDTYLHNLTHLTTLRARGKIAHIGVTNADAAHLRLLLDTGIPVAANQVSCSVLDRRAARGRLGALCEARGVALLCYGTLLGGLLSERWLGRPEPDPSEQSQLNWSLRKYLRFVRAAGGWAPFQRVLRTLDAVAKRHGVPIAAVATRWVLDLPGVRAVIVGTRLGGAGAGSREHAEGNLLAFSFALDEGDRALIAEAQEGLSDIPGDCGDEYRRPPYLTAAGDLSHHLPTETDRVRQVREAVAKGQRVEYLTGSKWEAICGYCRAVRVGSHIHISGTTANPPPGLPSLSCVGGTSAASQAVWIFDTIEGALKALGSSMRDIVRTRVILQDAGDAEAVSEEHGWRMSCAGILPANTLIEAGLYEEQMRVEMEVWAEVGSADHGVLQVFKP